MERRLVDELRAFFAAYMAAFDVRDGVRIATLYHEPTVTLRGDGSVHCLQSREELAGFFQGVADTYAREGARAWSYTGLEVVPLGGRSALATVDWQMHGADGAVMRGWRQSYNLLRTGAG